MVEVVLCRLGEEGNSIRIWMKSLWSTFCWLRRIEWGEMRMNALHRGISIHFTFMIMRTNHEWNNNQGPCTLWHNMEMGPHYYQSLCCGITGKILTQYWHNCSENVSIRSESCLPSYSSFYVYNCCFLYTFVFLSFACYVRWVFLHLFTVTPSKYLSLILYHKPQNNILHGR